MKFLKINFFIFFLSAILFQSCDYKREGDEISMDRNVSGFKRIVSQGSFNINLIRGDDYHMNITAGENVMPYISTVVYGDKLEIKLKRNRIRRIGTINIDITLPEITHFSLNGSGDIRTLNSFEGGNLDIEINGSGNMDFQGNFTNVESIINGSGDIILQGTAEDLYARIEGSGNINAIDLPVKTAKALIYGSGDIKVAVSDHLKVNISGSGDVLYQGEPSTEISVSGSGEIKKI